jgi:hypothetical protein
MIDLLNLPITYQNFCRSGSTRTGHDLEPRLRPLKSPPLAGYNCLTLWNCLISAALYSKILGQDNVTPVFGWLSVWLIPARILVS